MSNQQKLKSHICNDACKGRMTNSFKCFVCDSEFYSKCFGIEKPIYSKFNNENSFIRSSVEFVKQTNKNADR